MPRERRDDQDPEIPAPEPDAQTVAGIDSAYRSLSERPGSSLMELLLQGYFGTLARFCDPTAPAWFAPLMEAEVTAFDLQGRLSRLGPRIWASNESWLAACYGAAYLFIDSDGNVLDSPDPDRVRALAEVAERYPEHSDEVPPAFAPLSVRELAACVEQLSAVWYLRNRVTSECEFERLDGSGEWDTVVLQKDVASFETLTQRVASIEVPDELDRLVASAVEAIERAESPRQELLLWGCLSRRVEASVHATINGPETTALGGTLRGNPGIGRAWEVATLTFRERVLGVPWPTSSPGAKAPDRRQAAFRRREALSKLRPVTTNRFESSLLSLRQASWVAAMEDIRLGHPTYREPRAAHALPRRRKQRAGVPIPTTGPLTREEVASFMRRFTPNGDPFGTPCFIVARFVLPYLFVDRDRYRESPVPHRIAALRSVGERYGSDSREVPEEFAPLTAQNLAVCLTALSMILVERVLWAAPSRTPDPFGPIRLGPYEQACGESLPVDASVVRLLELIPTAVNAEPHPAKRLLLWLCLSDAVEREIALRPPVRRPPLRVVGDYADECYRKAVLGKPPREFAPSPKHPATVFRRALATLGEPHPEIFSFLPHFLEDPGFGPPWRCVLERLEAQPGRRI
ncbi:MAG: hypothetical protein KIS66_16600 [Fimbriimonadaceae bacterium]|nr:hypothetical protein [Fimbriimonadaceae bacterium]